ncbi:MAG: universal stress protein [Gammaproteobacteria bacterium]|jgi:nucleotide-binding universal stress UspA family protein|nr:universal stress protein [Gammaproteobacteria bacterium]
MTRAKERPRKVLAVMDDSDTQVALRTAAALADRHGASLEAFVCVEPPHDLAVVAQLAGRDAEGLLADLRERTLQDMQERIAGVLPDRRIDLRLAVGKTFVEVIRHVIESGCNFVVKAAEPLSGKHRFFFASTDQHLLRKCPCPVWLQTPEARPIPRCVLAAVDVDDWDAAEPDTLFSLNRRVIETAREIAAPSGAEVIVLHAWDAVADGMVWAFSSEADTRTTADAYVNEVFDARHKAMERLISRVKQDGAGSDGAPVFPSLVRGTPERVIEEQSRELGADVVVMGTVARTGLSGLFIGNTAENIINSLQCPILAVKPDGFVSPLASRP